MTKLNQIYKCVVCGNVVEVNYAGAGELVCCNQPMNLLTENTEEAATEKHVPVVKKIDGGVKVHVGEIAHPMEEDHFIEWIEVLSAGKSQKIFLQPGDQPEAVFAVEGDEFTVRVYCNLHGLWKV